MTRKGAEAERELLKRLSQRNVRRTAMRAGANS
jgi:Holliday junction resolvase